MKYSGTVPKAKFLLTCFPGIGHIGRIVADTLMPFDRLGEFIPTSLPHIALIGEDSLLFRPQIVLYGRGDILLVSGHYQPSDDELIELAQEIDRIASKAGAHIICVGGIGVDDPHASTIFATGRDDGSIIGDFDRSLAGYVGSVVGISGILPLITKRKAMVLLVEVSDSSLVASGQAMLDAIGSIVGGSWHIEQVPAPIEVQDTANYIG